MNTEVQQYVNLMALRVRQAGEALDEGRSDDAIEGLAQRWASPCNCTRNWAWR